MMGAVGSALEKFEEEFCLLFHLNDYCSFSYGNGYTFS